ncbi:MAG: UvrD-helicase domain-containing protein [Polyangiaceae bacterium]|nr:UvrD-helicase domain-containing protein [Polyangiaceae bacterium]
MDLDEARLYAPTRNLVLVASAGTGKTHALVGVIVHLLLLGAPSDKERLAPLERTVPVAPAHVVATTFSRKAAAEIRARVSSELERLSVAPETSSYMESLRARLLPGEKPTPYLNDSNASHDASQVTKLVTRRAREALAHLYAARFGTLHSFATSIVQSFALELGIGPSFEIATEDDVRTRSEEAIVRALEARLASNANCVRALVEAAGGIDQFVGQLRKILTQLEEDGRSPQSLGVCSTDEAQIEWTMQKMVEHARVLSRHPRFEDAARAFALAWDTRDDAGIQNAMAAFASVPARGKSDEVQAFGEFRKELAGATNEERGKRLLYAYRSRHAFAECARVVRDVLSEADAEIKAVGRAKASLGFGEILQAARELLQGRPDVAEEVAREIDTLLVDEVQDISRVQRDLIQLFRATPENREAGRIPTLATLKPRGLVVVGDRKQSIYGFRGADVGVFAELAVGLAGEPARVALGIAEGMTWQPKEPLADFCALRHNRRSVPELLAFANALSARRFRPLEPQSELFEIDYVPSTEDLLVPDRFRFDAISSLAAAVRSSKPEEAVPVRSSPTASISRQLESGLSHARLQPARTTWLKIAPKGQSSSRLEEALVIAERIGAMTKATSAPMYRDIAVLATTNAMLDAVAFALAQTEIPYVVAGRSFFRTREVADLLAMLSLVLDPSDRLAALEVLRGPWASVHDETLLGLTWPEGGLADPSHWTSPPRPELVRDDDRANLRAVATLVTELVRCAGRLGPGPILRHAVDALCLGSVLIALARGEQRVANVHKLLAIADRYVDSRAFRAWLVNASEQEFSESEAATFSEQDNAVRLLTVHASKGLDFPIVFVPEIAAAPPRVSKGAVRMAIGTGDGPNVLAVRIANEQGVVLEPPSYAKAYANTRQRERAERQRLAYVAVTRAANAMFLVGGSARARAGDPGASTLAVLEELAGNEETLAASHLNIETVAVVVPLVSQHDATTEGAMNRAPTTTHIVGAPFMAPNGHTPLHPKNAFVGAQHAAPLPRDAPQLPTWQHLSIAPTALADFDHCKRRFELVHLLGLPEHLRGRPGTKSAAGGSLDARTQGVLAHAVLERVPNEAFASDAARENASCALEAEGIALDHPQHDAIVQRVTRFLQGTYAERIKNERAQVHREVPFVMDVNDTQGANGANVKSVTLQGNIDLVVKWPDGSLDVVDYKSGRNAPFASAQPNRYALQLDSYALAARTTDRSVSHVRAGLVFLGGGAAEPVWCAVSAEKTIVDRIIGLGDALVRARHTRQFPREPLARCEAIYCGFIGRCHRAGAIRTEA